MGMALTDSPLRHKERRVVGIDFHVDPLRNGVEPVPYRNTDRLPLPLLAQYLHHSKLNHYVSEHVMFQ